MDIATLALIGGILCETWIVGGLLSAYTISGGSMAPALLGPHREITCPQCGYSWAADWTGLDDQPFFTCPDCGTAARRDPSRLSAETSGDRIFLDRTVLGSSNGLQRWDPVAFRHPERTRELVVKRIVGLPGEQIEIRDGDVYINGENCSEVTPAIPGNGRARVWMESRFGRDIPFHVGVVFAQRPERLDDPAREPRSRTLREAGEFRDRPIGSPLALSTRKNRRESSTCSAITPGGLGETRPLMKWLISA